MKRHKKKVNHFIFLIRKTKEQLKKTILICALDGICSVLIMIHSEFLDQNHKRAFNSWFDSTI